MDAPKVLLEVSQEWSDPTTGRVVLEGRLSRETAAVLAPAIHTLVSEGATAIEIDTTRLRSIDDAGRDALAAVRRQATEAGLPLSLLTSAVTGGVSTDNA